MDDVADEEVRRQIAAADAAYRPFAPFSEWAAEPVGLGSWDDAAARLAEVRERTPVEAVRSALDEVLRAAAVDTGAIEGLYTADRGFTLSVARNVISLDQAEVEAGLGFRRSFEAQRAGFQRALQLATGDEVLSEAALRELHRVTCADDATYRVLTPAGVQERTLVLGAYKTEPNHVQLAAGTFHAYAPVDRVTDEVHRLVEEMHSPEFRAAPVVVQAAFAHHALTAVHPFADGNGRVARLVASVWLLRAASIPLWVETTDRDSYLDALSAADEGDRQPLLRLVTSLTLRLLRGLRVAVETPVEPSGPSAEESAAEAAAGVLAAEVQAALGAERSAFVVHPAPVTGPAPDGVWVPTRATVALEGTPTGFSGPSRRGLAVGIDHRADDLSRFCVLVFDAPFDGRLIRREDLEVDDLLPEMSPSGRRRLTDLARLVVAEARAEQRARPEGSTDSR